MTLKPPPLVSSPPYQLSTYLKILQILVSATSLDGTSLNGLAQVLSTSKCSHDIVPVSVHLTFVLYRCYIDGILYQSWPTLATYSPWGLGTSIYPCANVLVLEDFRPLAWQTHRRLHNCSCGYIARYDLNCSLSSRQGSWLSSTDLFLVSGMMTASITPRGVLPAEFQFSSDPSNIPMVVWLLSSALADILITVGLVAYLVRWAHLQLVG